MSGTTAMEAESWRISAIALHPANATVYAMGLSNLYKSTDAGSTWQDVPISGTVHWSTLQLAVGTVGSDELWLSNRAGVYKSTDGGSNWVQSKALTDPASQMTVMPGKIAVASDDVLVYSVDNGVTWLTRSGPGTVDAMVVSPSNSNEIYWSAGKALYKSTNGGSNWSSLAPAMKSDYFEALAIGTSDASVVYAGGILKGLQKTVNAGTSWAGINTGYANGAVSELINDTVQENTLYARSGDKGWKSVNGGASWVAMAGGLPDEISSLVGTKSIPMVLYAAANKSVYKSIDGGSSWTEGAATPDFSLGGGGIIHSSITSIGVLPDGSQLYALTSWAGLFKSVDGGASWTPLPGSPSGMQIVVSTSAVYITTDSSGVYKSTNGGTSWTNANTGLTSAGGNFGFVAAIGIDPKNSDALYLAMTSSSFVDDVTLYKSTNAGGNWTPVDASFSPDENYLSYRTLMVDPNNSATVYAAGRGAKVSRNDGVTGVSFEEGLDDNSYYHSMSAIATNPSKLYMGADDGVYTIPIRTTINPATLTAAVAGTAYSQALSTVDGLAPFTYAVTTGALPAGVALSADGVLSGTPTVRGTFNFTVQSVGGTGGMEPTTGSRAYSLEVGAATLVLTPTNLSAGTVNASYVGTISASGGVAPYSYAISAGALPAGLSLNSTTGEISGTPTVVATSTFTVTATDASNSTGAQTYSVVVSAAPATAPSAPTSVTAIAGNGQAAVSFVAGSNGGAAITDYTVTASPGGASASGSVSPIIVSGLANGTAYTFTVTATNSVGTGLASAPSGSVTPKGPQTITFANPGTQMFGTTSSMGASSSSGLAVSYTAISPTVCSVSMAGAVTYLATGFCVIQADQAGDGAYMSAVSVTQLFAVTVGIPGAPLVGSATAGDKQAMVAFTAPAMTGGGAIVGYTVTASPGGATGTGTGSPIVVTGLNNGTAYTFTVTASTSAGSGVASAASNSVTPKGSQTITFANPGPQNFGTAPVLMATSTSGLAVAFSSGTPAVCTVSGVSLAFVSAGLCTINANQAGDGSYLAAATVPQSFNVNAVAPGAPTIGTATAGDQQATVTFTAPAANGGAAVTGYTVTSNPGGLTGTGAASSIVVTGLTYGVAYTFTVTASNSAGTGSASAASNSVTPKGTQTITFANPGAQNFGTTPVLTAISTSGLAVAFSSGTPAVCTVSGVGLAFVSAGMCTINANQAGDGSYLAATQVVQSFSVNPVVPGAPTVGAASAGDQQASVAFTAPVATGGAAVTGYTVTSNPGGLSGAGTASPIVVAALTNGVAYTFTVTASNSAGSGVASAPSNSVTPKGTQTITFANPGAQNFGAAPTLVATSTSALAVSFTSSTSAVCTVTSAGVLTLLSTGTCSIKADQAGNGTYLAATAVDQSFVVNAVAPGAPTVGTATAGDKQASVTFTAPANTGGAAVTGYTVTSSPGGLTATGAASPIVVTGLTNDTAYTFTVKATNSAGTSPASAASNSVTPIAALAVSTTSLPNAQMAVAYSQNLAATGGTAPYTWAMTVGTLPAGLSMSTAGAITGTPTAATTAAVAITVQVKDANGTTADKALTIAVSPVTLSVLSAAGDFASLQMGQPFSVALSAAGGVAPYSWQATGLPNGLAVVGNAISGTPSQAGSFTVTLTVTDSSTVTRSAAVAAGADVSKAAATATQTFAVTVAPAGLAISTSSLAAAEEKLAYSQALAATGGTAPYNWQATGLPAGVVLDAATGMLSGTATTAGAYPVVLTVTDSSATPATATATLSLQVNAAGQTVAAVPVPGLAPWSVAMLGALLAMLAGLQRRRVKAA